jgi:hypothetical protein
MTQSSRTIVKQVLTEAVDAPHFFDYSDAQRLNWMIERAYELGQRQQRSPSKGRTRRKRRSPRKQPSSPRPFVSILVKAH